MGFAMHEPWATLGTLPGEQTFDPGSGRSCRQPARPSTAHILDQFYYNLCSVRLAKFDTNLFYKQELKADI